MLAGLRVLHVAPSHAPAPPTQIEELPLPRTRVPLAPKIIERRVHLTPTDVPDDKHGGDGSAWE